MPRSFNTAGPCRPALHYMLPPLERLPEARPLVERGHYFILHAPRQTGKTTLLRTLAETLTAAGTHAALLVSCEAGSVAGEDYEAAQRAILDDLRLRAESALPPELRPPPFPEASALGLFRVALAAWARACPRPIALLLDEIDSLQGQSLIAVLRQLRAGYDERPQNAPASVVLCGMRNVRDYKSASGGGPVRLGSASPFNVSVKDLRIGNFSEADVRTLYAQHTEETGQIFTDDALTHVLRITGGQPWLVNAVAREIVEEMRVPPSEPLTAAHVERAKERLILARATHLDSLIARLSEPRVRRVLEPVLAGTLGDAGEGYNDDFEYVADLGLVRRTLPIDVANPIYREVMARVLASPVEARIPVPPGKFVLPDGRLDMKGLLDAFEDFWREQGEIVAGDLPWHEAAPQLVLMAFLQRVVNGGGIIDREYGIGRKRIDLLVRWPYRDAEGKEALQREVLELKVWRTGEKDPLQKGLEQIDGYLERAGVEQGILVIFDQRKKKGRRMPFARRSAKTPAGRKVAVVRP